MSAHGIRGTHILFRCPGGGRFEAICCVSFFVVLYLMRSEFYMSRNVLTVSAFHYHRHSSHSLAPRSENKTKNEILSPATSQSRWCVSMRYVTLLKFHFTFAIIDFSFQFKFETSAQIVAVWVPEPRPGIHHSYDVMWMLKSLDTISWAKWLMVGDLSNLRPIRGKTANQLRWGYHMGTRQLSQMYINNWCHQSHRRKCNEIGW